MNDDPFGRAIQDILGSRPTAAARRQLAEQLHQLADEQTALADADTRVGHVARRVQLDSAPRKGGRPKGSGARFVRVEYGHGRSGRIHIGRHLWQIIGEPHRLDIQRMGARVALRPAAGDIGYSVTQPKNGMPRFSIGNENLTILRLDALRYEAHIEDGAILFSTPL